MMGDDSVTEIKTFIYYIYHYSSWRLKILSWPQLPQLLHTAITEYWKNDIYSKVYINLQKNLAKPIWNINNLQYVTSASLIFLRT